MRRRRSLSGGFSVSRDCSAVFWAQTDLRTSDLQIIDRWRPDR
jgi:hypothetical protein